MATDKKTTGQEEFSMKKQTRVLLEKLFPDLYERIKLALYRNMVTIVPTDEEVDEIFWFLLGNLSYTNVPEMLARFSRIYELERKSDAQRPIILICGKTWRTLEDELKIR